MWGYVSRRIYSCLTSVLIEINGIISVATRSRSRVKPTMAAHQGCLLKVCVLCVIKAGQVHFKRIPPPKAILNYEGKDLERKRF